MLRARKKRTESPRVSVLSQEAGSAGTVRNGMGSTVVCVGNPEKDEIAVLEVCGAVWSLVV